MSKNFYFNYHGYRIGEVYDGFLINLHTGYLFEYYDKDKGMMVPLKWELWDDYRYLKKISFWDTWDKIFGIHYKHYICFISPFVLSMVGIKKFYSYYICRPDITKKFG